MRLPQVMSRSCRPFITAAVAALVAGCTGNGDFANTRPSLVRDDIHAFVGRDAIAGVPTGMSHFELTDDERLLRDLAYPLLEQPYNRHKDWSVFHETGAWGGDRRAVFDPTSYTDHLLGDRYRSPSARYARLIDDIRNDSVRTAPFFEVAGRVSDIDRKRAKAIVLANSGAREAKHANRRIAENASIIRLVQASFDRRIASYRFALERLVVMTPSPMAVDAERSLTNLQARIAQRGPGPVRIEQRGGSLNRPL